MFVHGRSPLGWPLSRAWPRLALGQREGCGGCSYTRSHTALQQQAVLPHACWKGGIRRRKKSRFTTPTMDVSVGMSALVFYCRTAVLSAGNRYHLQVQQYLDCGENRGTRHMKALKIDSECATGVPLSRLWRKSRHETHESLQNRFWVCHEYL